MSIKLNNQIIAGLYESQIIPQADTVNSGIIRIATQKEINDGIDNTTVVTPFYLKQNVAENVKADGITVVKNDDNSLTTVGQKSINNIITVDWIGTKEEYELAWNDGTITSTTVCYITDDEEDASVEGVLFIPHIEKVENGIIISWTNNQGYDNPDPVLIPSSENNIPIGGTSGQVLSKKSDLDYDLEWKNIESGITDYVNVDNKPQINNIELVGNKTLEELGIQPSGDYALNSDIPNVENFVTKQELNVSNMYLTGDISNDERGYYQLKDMYHSTFDLSKFEVVGNPTISEDGIATGFPFNSQTYLKIFNEGEFDFNKPWQMDFKITPGTLPDAENRAHWFLSALNNKTRNIVLGIEGKNRVLKVYLSSDGISFFANGTVGTAIFVTGNIYYIRVIYDLTKYEIQYSTDGIKYITDIEIENSLPLYNGGLKLGDNETDTNGFRDGLIDLKYFSIISEGISVFNGNKNSIDIIEDIEIPYTESKTGSKIVDSIYRDRVQSIYEKLGYTEYYTIDELNKNFTLPTGEIYGIIANKANKSEIPDTSNFATKDEISDFITISDVESKGYLTEIPSEYITDIELSNELNLYAKKSEIPEGSIIDDAFSTTSANAVQNKVITNKLNQIESNIPTDFYTQGEIDDKISNVVHLDGEETITGEKTFTKPVKIQNGQGTGCMWVGANVNSGELTNNKRHLARISSPSFSNVDLATTLLGFDSSGDSDLHVANKNYDAVSFGGQKKITNATSPMSIGFCVTNKREATSANNKVYALEMDANEARFNVQPNYNGIALATTVDLETKQNVLTAGENITIENGVISATGGGGTATVEVDGVTIHNNIDNKLEVIGEKTKNNITKHTWIGTKEEYSTDLNNGIITPETECIITDDEENFVIDSNCYTKSEVDNLIKNKGFNLFDTKVSDHVLKDNEALGWVLQGTYVYKEGVAGLRYGYPDFYNKVIEEFNEATSTETVNGAEINVHSNGHKFYDISDKDSIDNYFDSMGYAWFYGIDTENQRIFLPRTKYFAVTGGVKGNGTSLGVTDGKENLVLTVPGGAGVVVASTGAYGQPVGSTSANNKSTTSNSFGLTTESNKSGITLEYDESKYLYICVGNVTVDKAQTDVTEITTSENDTLPLFHNLYSKEDMTTTGAYINASEGGWHDGNKYPTAYQELVNKLGTDNVKAVIDTFTDYDFVVNQDDMTFRLPLKNGQEVMFATGVKGDGKTLGLTDGANEVGLSAISTGTLLLGYVENINTQVGSSAGSTPNAQGKTVGLATDSTKSGIELDTENITIPDGWKLYYKVANALSNLEIMDVAKIESTKADKTAVDGQWVQNYLLVASDLSFPKSDTGTTYDLSTYLPNDGYDYEVLFAVAVDTGKTSGNTVGIRLGTDIIPIDLVNVVTAKTQASNAMPCGATVTLPVGSGRYVQIRNSGNATGTLNWVRAVAYRRLGTNP